MLLSLFLSLFSFLSANSSRLSDKNFLLLLCGEGRERKIEEETLLSCLIGCQASLTRLQKPIQGDWNIFSPVNDVYLQWNKWNNLRYFSDYYRCIIKASFILSSWKKKTFSVRREILMRKEISTITYQNDKCHGGMSILFLPLRKSLVWFRQSLWSLVALAEYYIVQHLCHSEHNSRKEKERRR